MSFTMAWKFFIVVARQLKRMPLKLLRYLVKQPKVASMIVFLSVCALLPVRLPIFYTYPVLLESDIPGDLHVCVPGLRMENDTDACPLVPDYLGYYQPISQTMSNLTLRSMAANLGVKRGGHWSPSSCSAWQKVAIIIPFRNREDQLNTFLQHLHPFLQAQLIDYRIYVIEQSEAREFNRGQLLNIGFVEALNEAQFCCFIFHDVDLLPVSPRQIYGCSTQPRHMSSAIDVFRYNLPYPELFGGVVAFTTEQFKLVNGYSNAYYGWGGEDDDLYNRVRSKGMDIIRWDSKVSRYIMIPHAKASPNPQRHKLLYQGIERMRIDGLNSLKYEVVNRYYRYLYTRFVVEVKS